MGKNSRKKTLHARMYSPEALALLRLSNDVPEGQNIGLGNRKTSENRSVGRSVNLEYGDYFVPECEAGAQYLPSSDPWDQTLTGINPGTRNDF